MAAGWLQPLLQRLGMWTAPFLTGGGCPVDDHGRTVVYHRWRPPMSYPEFVARYHRQGKPVGLRDEPLVFRVCAGRGHLQAAQRWRDTCAGCGADIPVGAVGLADHARGSDMADFGHACGVSNPPTQTAVTLAEGDDGLARRVRARIIDRAEAAQGGIEDGADPRQQRLLVADGLDAVCADLIAGLRDRLRSLVSDELQQENHHRTRQLGALLDTALHNLGPYKESLTVFADAFPVTVAGDQPARPPGSRLCFDLPVVPASSLTVHASTRAAHAPDTSPEPLRLARTVPADTASAVILAHNATLAAAAAQ